MILLLAFPIALASQNADAVNAQGRATARAYLEEVRKNPAVQSSRVAVGAEFSSVVDENTHASDSTAFANAIAGCKLGRVSVSADSNEASRSEVMIDWTCRGKKPLFATIVVKDGKITGVWWGAAPILLMPGMG